MTDSAEGLEIENLRIGGNTYQESGNITDEENVIGTTPSIDYPSEIKRVAGDVEVGVSGKNMIKFAKEDWIRGYFDGLSINNYFDINGSMIDEKYYRVPEGFNNFVVSFLPKKDFILTRGAIAFYDRGKKPIGTIGSLFNDNCKYYAGTRAVMKYVYQVPSGARYFRFNLRGMKNLSNQSIKMYDEFYDYVSELQLEVGTEGTEYVPYEGGNYPILLGDMELYGNDTVRDNICKENGKWYIERNWNKVILDGVNYKFTYKHGTIQTDTQGFFASAFENKDNVHTSGSTDFAFCNCLKLKDGGPSSAIYEDYIWWEGNSNNIYFSLPYTTLADANAWLQEKYGSGNPVEVIYKIANSKKEEITDETLIAQLENLINAKTCKEITHVDSVTDNLSPILSFCYRKDLQIENDRIKARLDEIEALLSTTSTSALLLDNLENDLKGEVM